MTDQATGASRTYTVGEVGTLSGVSVRTLHHYEQIGLLVPHDRTAAGYRLYGSAELDRLRTILFYRELGFALPEIATIVDDPEQSPVEHLRRQRALLIDRQARIDTLVATIDKELEARAMGVNLTDEEKFEIFGADYDPAWESEAEERWGESDAWKTSTQRTANFSKDDWKRVKADQDALMADLATAKRSGVTPGDPEANALADRHRASIDTFYPCTYEMQRCLADMYLADARFTATYDDVEPGLAQWVHDIVHANADAHGAGPASEADWG